jgi:hypothetical protein
MTLFIRPQRIDCAIHVAINRHALVGDMIMHEAVLKAQCATFVGTLSRANLAATNVILSGFGCTLTETVKFLIERCQSNTQTIFARSRLRGLDKAGRNVRYARAILGLLVILATGANGARVPLDGVVVVAAPKILWEVDRRA